MSRGCFICRGIAKVRPVRSGIGALSASALTEVGLCNKFGSNSSDFRVVWVLCMSWLSLIERHGCSGTWGRVVVLCGSTSDARI